MTTPISEIINKKELEELAFARLNNPIPILQQRKSNITTNPFILGRQPLPQPIKTVSRPFTDFSKNLAQSCMGFLDDLYTKPNDQNWHSYIIFIIYKDNRHQYIGIFLLLIALAIFIKNW
jgi:hypothetical protein